MPASSTARSTLAAALLLASASASAHPWQDDAAASLPVASAALAPYVTFEAGPVQALLLTPDGRRLLALNTQDDRIEVYGVEIPATAGRTPQPGSGSMGKKPAPGGPSVPPLTGPPGAPPPLPALSWRGSVFTGLSPVAMALDPADPTGVRRQPAWTASRWWTSPSAGGRDARRGRRAAGPGGHRRQALRDLRARAASRRRGGVDPGELVNNVVAVHAPRRRTSASRCSAGAVRPRDLAGGNLVYAIPQDSGNHTTLLDGTAARPWASTQLMLDAFDLPCR